MTDTDCNTRESLVRTQNIKEKPKNSGRGRATSQKVFGSSAKGVGVRKLVPLDFTF